MHYENYEQITNSYLYGEKPEYKNKLINLNMTEDELDTIIRLIPKATPRQTEVIEGQILIHKELTQKKEYKK